MTELLRQSSDQQADLLAATEQLMRGAGTAAFMAKAVDDVGKRISAFVRLAEYYQRGRNATLTSEILAEAQILAATRLGQRERSASFAQIAMVQGLTGDMAGAMAAIDNAAEGAGREQLLAALADRLLDSKAYRRAQSVMDQMQHQAAVARLAVRMITQVYYQGDVTRAKLLLAAYSGAVRKIADLGQRGLLLSQYARLHARMGQEDMAQSLFAEVKQISRGLTGRKVALVKGLLVLNQARSLWLDISLNTLEEIDLTFVRDPLYSEVMVIKRTLTTLMPAAVQARPRYAR